MFDISWTEFLLIGVVALVVIGPKELPGVLRTLGQWTRKMRSMAADFQNQFREAMHEAEMTDLKKQVDEIAHDFKSLNPLKGARDKLNAMGTEFETSLDREPTSATAQSDEPVMTEAATPASPIPQGPSESPEPETAAKPRDSDVAPAVPEPAVAPIQQKSTERIG